MRLLKELLNEHVMVITTIKLTEGDEASGYQDVLYSVHGKLIDFSRTHLSISMEGSSLPRLVSRAKVVLIEPYVEPEQTTVYRSDLN